MLYICNLYNVVHQLYLNKKVLRRVNIRTYRAYIQYIMRNAGLDEAQTGIKIAGRGGSTEPPLGSVASLSRAPQQWATLARVWYLLDGKMQPPGKLAALASVRLQGLHKPVYRQLSDCRDHIVIMNTRHIAFSGNKWEHKVLSSHTTQVDLNE